MLLAFALSISTYIHANVKMDTVDYWHVLYNNKTIARYNQTDKTPPIIVKSASIKFFDMLVIQYGNDTPSEKIKTGLYILDNNRQKVILTTGKGLDPLKVSLNKLLILKTLYHYKKIDLHYFDDRRDQFLFQLKIE
jgi:hypothetical protein